VSDARAARAAAESWLAANRSRWPDLRAAHFVGGITALADAETYPSHKDIDLHLVVADGSPALAPSGPFPAIVEDIAGLWPIEAGIKSDTEYRSPEVVLANPEIAHHLTLDSILFDPENLLAGLQGPVRNGYARRQWVTARLANERSAFAGALGMRPMAAAHYGFSGEINVLGYLMTFPTAALGVAALGPPRIGGRALVHLRTAVTTHGRPELHEGTLEVLGVAGATAEGAREWLDVGASLFDRAVEVRRTPHPFQHKLHAHLRPYFVDSCRTMISEGYHREALGWTTPFVLASLDVLQADGTERDRTEAAENQRSFFEYLGFTTADVVEERYARALRVYEEIFDLADEIAAANPAIVD
jgi:hypothetical protein